MISHTEYRSGPFAANVSSATRGDTLDQVRTVLEASDIQARDQVIIAHLEHMEETLVHAQATVASLKALLEGHEPTLPVEYRTVAATQAIAIAERVDWDDTEEWLSAALHDLHTVLASTPGARAGVDSALYSTEFFQEHVGEVIASPSTANRCWAVE